MNQNALEIVLLGTGTCVLDTGRNPTAILLKYGEHTLLVDIGPGIARSMARHMDPYSLDALAVTHFHTDHINDLAALTFAYRNTPGLNRTLPLEILGPKGTVDFWNSLNRLHDGHTEPQCGIRLHELDAAGGSLDLFPDFRLSWAEASHGDRNALSYRADAGNRSVTMTGDTEPNPHLADLAADTDLLIAECSATDDLLLPGHMAPSQIAQIAAQARPRHIVLVHLYPESEAADPQTRLQSMFDGKVTLGRDHMKITL